MHDTTSSTSSNPADAVPSCTDVADSPAKGATMSDGHVDETMNLRELASDLPSNTTVAEATGDGTGTATAAETHPNGVDADSDDEETPLRRQRQRNDSAA